MSIVQVFCLRFSTAKGAQLSPNRDDEFNLEWPVTEKGADANMNHYAQREKETETLRIEAPQRRYFLLDRDGVINRRNSIGHVKSWDQFEFLPRALDALRLLAVNHYAGIVISRQARTSDGLSSSTEIDTITRRFLLEIALSGGHIAQVYYCRHREENGCDCYNSNTGLIAKASADHGFLPEEAHFVSERELDLQAAQEAGCPCIRIQRDAFLQTPISCTEQDHYKVASNLYEAAEQILASSQVREGEYAAFQSR
jgi:D-glycero-D-manno-heptose 1,7-bisphosphate phosphatase